MNDMIKKKSKLILMCFFVDEIIYNVPPITKLANTILVKLLSCVLVHIERQSKTRLNAIKKEPNL